MYDWKYCKLRRMGKIVGGGTPARERPEYWNGTIPWITPSEVTAYSKKHIKETQDYITELGLASSAAKLVPKHTLLITSRASIGFCVLAGSPMTTNQGFKNLIPHDEIDPDFLFHLGNTLSREMTRRASGTTFLEISAHDFGQIEIHLPPLKEQKRIAEILDSLDQTIQTTKQLITKHRKIRQGLAHDLLKGPPSENRAVDKSEQAGNRWAALSDIAEINPRHPSPKIGETISFIAMADVSEFGNIDNIEIKNAAPGYTPFAAGDVLVAKITPCFENGKGAHVLALPTRYGLGSTEFHILRPLSTISNRFLYHLTRTSQFRHKGKGLMTGSAGQQRVPSEFFDRYIVSLPPLKEQKRIAAILDSADLAIQENEAELAKLQKLRSGLASDLLSGKVRTVAA